MTKAKSIAALAAACIMAVSLSSCVLAKAGKLQSYDLGNDSVPSINSVVGERKVAKVETGNGTDGQFVEYKYESGVPTDDIQTYLTELQEQGWIATQNEGDESSGTVQLSLESGDDGKIVSVTINYGSDSYTVNVKKYKGELTRYEE